MLTSQTKTTFSQTRYRALFVAVFRTIIFPRKDMVSRTMIIRILLWICIQITQVMILLIKKVPSVLLCQKKVKVGIGIGIWWKRKCFFFSGGLEKKMFLCGSFHVICKVVFRVCNLEIFGLLLYGLLCIYFFFDLCDFQFKKYGD